MVAVSGLLLVLSGTAALVYQVAWVRLLSLGMGSTSATISTILAAFFLGLAIGSYISKTRLFKMFNGFWVYACIEAVIAVFGLISLPVMLNLDAVLTLFPQIGTAISFKFFLTLAVLAIPTICMGATFPVINRVVTRLDKRLDKSLSTLYSLNTLGAVLGALLSGFLLIPSLGVDGAIYTAVCLNLIAAVIAWLIGWNFESKLEKEQKRADKKPSGKSRARKVPLVPATAVLFVTGFTSIATEVGWTKYLAIYTGATIYGFSAILTIFLLGIAIGAWVGKTRLFDGSNVTTRIWSLLLLLAAALLIARWGMSIMPSSLDLIRGSESSAVQLFVKCAFVLVVLFIPTFLFGALFPITLYAYSHHGAYLSRADNVGSGYAINTLASILGAVAAGFLVIPYFGTDVLLISQVILVAVCALLFFPLLEKNQHKPILIGGVAGLIALSLLLPGLSYRSLISEVRYRFDSDATAGKNPEFLFLKEGKAGVISLVTYDDEYAKLQNNGIQESFLDLTGNDYRPKVETMLGLVPYFLHPGKPESAFVIGFGGGTTVTSIAKSDVKTVRVVELEPAVTEAVGSVTGGKIPVLQDPRVEIEYNDARNSLLVENKSYDLIIAQPSHPWLSGAGNLFTKEFFQIVRSRLNDRGVYGQWINLFNMDSITLKSILKAYFSVFSHGLTMANEDTGDMLLFGSTTPLQFNQKLIYEKMQLPQVNKALKAWRITSPASLYPYFSLSREDALRISESVEANSDLTILSEVRLATLIEDPEGELSPYRMLNEAYTMDIVPYLEPSIAPTQLYRLGVVAHARKQPERLDWAVKRLKDLSSPLAEKLELRK